VTMSAGSAEARDGRKGALIAAGVLGALAVGAIAAQANESRHGYYVDDGYAADDVYAPAYRQPRTVYQQPVQYYRSYEPHPGYGYYRPHRPRHPGYSETGYAYRGPVCKLKKQQVWDGYGWRVQRVQVCR
jgi:hypothetical protein